MRWLGRLHKPWLHFLVLGSVLYQIQITVFPDPKTVIGPLSASRQEALQQQWLSKFWTTAYCQTASTADRR